MRVLVCGSRTFKTSFVSHMLSGEFNIARVRDSEPFVVIEGGAKGADECAALWAWSNRVHGVRHEQYKADWDRYGKSAGYIRNQQMLDEGKPDLVVAFVDKPLVQSKGTFNMVHLARLAGVKTVVVECLP